MITRRVVYETKGQQFETPEKAVEHRENLVAEFLGTLPGFYDLPLKQRIPFIDALLRRRRELIDLLSYDLPKEDEDP